MYAHKPPHFLCTRNQLQRVSMSAFRQGDADAARQFVESMRRNSFTVFAGDDAEVNSILAQLVGTTVQFFKRKDRTKYKGVVVGKKKNASMPIPRVCRVHDATAALSLSRSLSLPLPPSPSLSLPLSLVLSLALARNHTDVRGFHLLEPPTPPRAGQDGGTWLSVAGLWVHAQLCRRGKPSREGAMARCGGRS